MRRMLILLTFMVLAAPARGGNLVLESYTGDRPADAVRLLAPVLEELARREYAAGSPPVFAICNRDGLAVMLRRVAAPELIRPNESQGGTWDAFFWVDDAAALHAELVGRGATVVYGPIIQEAYHMREFAVRDRDGHVLGFGQALGG